MAAIDYAQQLWTKTLRCGSIYIGNRVKGLFVKDVNKSISRTLRQWWSEQQFVSFQDPALMAEPSTDLHGNKPCPDDQSDSKRTEAARSWEQAEDANLMADKLWTSKNDHLQGPLLNTQIGQHQPTNMVHQQIMSMSDVVTAVKSGEFGLDDRTSITSTTFGRVCVIDNHKKSRCQKIMKIASVILTNNRIFSYCCNQLARANSKQPHQQPKYQQGLNPRGRWSSCDLNPLSNQSPTPSTSTSETQTAVVPVLPKLWNLCQLTGLTRTPASLPARVHHHKTGRTQKHWITRVKGWAFAM